MQNRVARGTGRYDGDYDRIARLFHLRHRRGVSLSEAILCTWDFGWRFPFWISGVLLVIGLVIRFCVPEMREFLEGNRTFASRKERPRDAGS